MCPTAQCPDGVDDVIISWERNMLEMGHILTP